MVGKFLRAQRRPIRFLLPRQGCTHEISLAETHGRLLTAARGPEQAWEGGPGAGETSEGPRFSDSCFLAAVLPSDPFQRP